MYIRNIAVPDWSSIMALQHQAYYHLDPESEAVLRSKVSVGQNVSFVAEKKDSVVAYLIAFSYPINQYPSLVKPEAEPFRCSNLLLHDLVVERDNRLEGIATRLLSVLRDVAKEQGYRTLSLVASDISKAFWQKQGFESVPTAVAPIHYGSGSVYMCLHIEDY
ncbi:GNAT family N-acetyltransferase [Thaumasiovibrio subtropicus]|uniref:GNAT family N-acetyltransferase n=1 Tax=Thaumasiovibrio subtropicus TaxID=1891207 RepID=UPI000B35D5B4|nr:GNAT family N-acetyltransferase [Thaumasiovibrio subtropicus]